MVIMIQSIINLALGICLEGMKHWNEDQRTRFNDEYYLIMKKIDAIKVKQYPYYYDSDLDLTNKELETFLKAYYNEIKKIGNPTIP